MRNLKIFQKSHIKNSRKDVDYLIFFHISSVLLKSVSIQIKNLEFSEKVIKFIKNSEKLYKEF